MPEDNKIYKIILVGGPSDGRTFGITKRISTILCPDPQEMSAFRKEEIQPEFMPMPKISRYVLCIMNTWPRSSNVLIYLYDKDVQSNGK